MLHKNSQHFGKYNSRPLNWICSGCNREIYGSKEFCVTCDIGRNGKKRTITPHPSGDWNCPTCKFRVSPNEQYCNTCKVDCYGKYNS